MFVISINNDSSSSAFQRRSAQKNFHAAIAFATQTNVEYEGYRKNPSPDRCRSLLILKLCSATLFKHFARRKNVDFHFHEKNFVSYDEIVDSITILTAIAYRFAVEIVFYDASNSR